MSKDYDSYGKVLTLHGRVSKNETLHTDVIKVAIVLPHFGYGGAERMVALLASHLDLNKFDVRVFCLFGNPHDNVMEHMVLEHGVPITFIRKGLGFSAKHLIRLWRELSKFRPEVVHTHTNALLYCAPWIMMHRPRMLHTLHNIPNKEATDIRQTIMRLLFHIGKAIPVTISETNRRLTADFYGLDEQIVEMIVNPVDVSSFHDEMPRRFEDRCYDLLCVGRFEKQKNHALLLKAIALYLETHPEDCDSLLIGLVGQGDLEESTRKLSSELGISRNICFLGLRDDVADLMHNSKVFVLSSDYEGLPMTILEAMAAGLPVLATSVGGVPDVVDNGVNGILVPPGDVNALALGIENLLTDQRKWNRARKSGLERIESFDSNVVADKYESLYRKYTDRTRCTR